MSAEKVISKKVDEDPFALINKQIQNQLILDNENDIYEAEDINNFNSANFGKQVYSKYLLSYHIDDELVHEIHLYLPKIDHYIKELINLQSHLNVKKLGKVSLSSAQMDKFKNLFQCLHVLSTNKNVLQSQDIYHSLFFPLRFDKQFVIRNWEKKHLKLNINNDIENDLNRLIKRLYFLSRVTLKNYHFVEEIITKIHTNNETKENEAKTVIKNLNLRKEMIEDIKKTLRFCLEEVNYPIEYLVKRAL